VNPVWELSNTAFEDEFDIEALSNLAGIPVCPFVLKRRCPRDDP
jgi:hypothetical protein